MEKHQSPCKTFNKRKSITCYKLKANFDKQTFEHVELFRVVNKTKGEYYILPIETLQKKINRHLSYHKSGAFHWREQDGQRIEPVEGEADSRRASLFNQAVKHVHGDIDGYCVARGRGVTEDSLEVMIDILDGYVIPPLKEIGVFETLIEKKNHSIFMMESPQRFLVQELVKAEIENSNVTYKDAEEVFKSIEDQMEAGVIRLDPKPEKFAIYKHDVQMRMFEIARTLVTEKMEQKPSKFWTEEESENYNQSLLDNA